MLIFAPDCTALSAFVPCAAVAKSLACATRYPALLVKILMLEPVCAALSAFVPCAAVAKSVVEDAAAVPKLGLFIKSL